MAEKDAENKELRARLEETEAQLKAAQEELSKRDAASAKKSSGRKKAQAPSLAEFDPYKYFHGITVVSSAEKTSAAKKALRQRLNDFDIDTMKALLNRGIDPSGKGRNIKDVNRMRDYYVDRVYDRSMVASAFGSH